MCLVVARSTQFPQVGLVDIAKESVWRYDTAVAPIAKPMKTDVANKSQRLSGMRYPMLLSMFCQDCFNLSWKVSSVVRPLNRMPDSFRMRKISCNIAHAALSGPGVSIRKSSGSPPCCETAFGRGDVATCPPRK